jgi:hypothetical protein
MDAGAQRLMVWSGPVVVVTFIIGLVPLSHFIPAPRPTASGEEIAALFRDDSTEIRIACALMMVGITFFATWGAGITVWIRRMEAGFPVLTYGSLILLGAGTVYFSSIPLVWALASFRPEIAPDTIRMLNDLAWFLFLFSWPPFGVWAALVGVAILRDHHTPALFPRWLAYLSFWAALLLTPATLMVFFKTGPFAFNGLITLYVPLIVYLAWMVVMTKVVLGAITKREHEQSRDVATVAG